MSKVQRLWLIEKLKRENVAWFFHFLRYKGKIKNCPILLKKSSE